MPGRRISLPLHVSVASGHAGGWGCDWRAGVASGQDELPISTSTSAIDMQASVADVPPQPAPGVPAMSASVAPAVAPVEWRPGDASAMLEKKRCIHDHEFVPKNIKIIRWRLHTSILICYKTLFAKRLFFFPLIQLDFRTSRNPVEILFSVCTGKLRNRSTQAFALYESLG